MRMAAWNWRLVRVTLGTLLIVLPYAMLTPQVVVHLDMLGHPRTLIAAFGAAPFVAILFVTPFVPRLIKWKGQSEIHFTGLIATAAASTATAFLLNIDTDAAGVFIAAAFGLGAASSLTWTATEAILAQHAHPSKVAKVMSAYQFGLGAAFAVGPFLPVLLYMTSLGMLLLTLVLAAAAIAVQIIGRRPDQDCHSDGRAALVSATKNRLLLTVLSVAGVAGIFELGLNSTLPLVGLDLGVKDTDAAVLVGLIACGALLSQLPIGVLVDELHDVLAHLVCGLALLISVCSLALSSHFQPALFIAALLAGAGGGGLYTLVMIEIARETAKETIPALTATAVLAYTTGAVVGQLGGGIASDLLGTETIWIVLTVPAALVTALALGRLRAISKEH
jgi:MFS family permease